MLWLPTTSELTVSVALPALSRVTEPSEVAPSENVTIPEGVPAPPPDAVTTAANTTACPKTLGFAELERTVVVVLWFTTCVTPPAPDADEALKFPSPA